MNLQKLLTQARKLRAEFQAGPAHALVTKQEMLEMAVLTEQVCEFLAADTTRSALELIERHFESAQARETEAWKQHIRDSEPATERLIEDLHCCQWTWSCVAVGWVQRDMDARMRFLKGVLANRGVRV